VYKNDQYTIENIIYELILAFLSSLVFYFIFEYFPNKKRKHKIRPILENYSYQIYYKLFYIFDVIFSRSSYSPSDYQNQIISGKINQNLIQLFLYGKCLSEEFLYKINDLIPIGNKLSEIYDEIETKINKSYYFSEYLDANEIILYEKIINKLRMYTLNDSAKIKVNGLYLYELDPSMSYMSKNFYEIYKLFLELQKTVLIKNKYLNRELFLDKLNFLYKTGKYNKLISISNKNQYENCDDLLLCYKCLSFMKLDKKEKFKEVFMKIIGNKNSLIGNRYFIYRIFINKKYKMYINNYLSDKKIIDMLSIIYKEEYLKIIFLKKLFYYRKILTEK